MIVFDDAVGGAVRLRQRLTLEERDGISVVVQFPVDTGDRVDVFREDADVVFDRYHTPDFIMWNDGIQLNREKLLAHVRPARKRARGVHVEVHETVTTADRVAARYTLTADMATGKTIATEIYMFGHLAADGRLRRVQQITRDVSPDR